MSERTTGRSETQLFWPPLLIATVTRVTIFMSAAWGIGMLGRAEPDRFFLHGEQPHPRLLVNLFQRWDSYWFLNVAHRGYQYHGVQRQIGAVPKIPRLETNITPFPLYPMLLAAGGKLLGDASLAGFLVSLVCYFLSMVVLYRLALEQSDEEAAFRTVLYLSIYPTGFIYNSVYSESLFLLLSLLALREALAGHPLRSGLCGLGASLTRLSGGLLAPCVFAELVSHGKKEGRSRALFQGILAAALVTAGWVAYFGYLHHLTGSFFTYFTAQHGWHKSFVAPWTSAWQHLLLGFRGNYQRQLELGCMALFLPLAVAAFFRLRFSLALYLALGLLMPLSSSNLLGLPRYLMVLFPAFLVLGRSARSSAANAAVIGTFSLVHGMVMLAWLRWQYSL
jgi:hypothetical protein